MTEQDWKELGRRAVACNGWRWMPGMAWAIPPWARDSFPEYMHHGRHPIPDAIAPLPDLRDPATLGCLLALVREAAEPERAPGDWPMVCTYQNAAKKWGVGAWLNESGKATFAALVLPTYDTEAAALVAALEAAPR